MSTKDAVKGRQPISRSCHRASPNTVEKALRVGLDSLDRLPLKMLDKSVLKVAEPTLTDATTALCDDATRREAMTRLLARAVQTARVQLRFFEALRNLALEKFLNGLGSGRKLDLLDRLVRRQHRRLNDCIALLLRIDQESPTVRIAIDAQQAAVLFPNGGIG